MIEFKPNIEKAKAVLLYISSQLTNPDFLKIFKILYFAEREHLAKYGRLIVGDTYIAMKHGPVPSFIYDVLKYLRGEGIYNPAYDPFVKALTVDKNYFVSTKEQVDLEELSKSDLECLNKSIAENKSYDFDTLSKKSHDEAWKQADPDDEMNLLKIAQAGGANEVMLKYIAERVEHQNIVFA